MSTVSITPIEEKAAVLDDTGVKGGSSNPKDYAIKFACASMSSECYSDASYAYF